MTSSSEKKICLALSGGIDSTFAGWLLKREGYDLMGVYLDLIDDDPKIVKAKMAADFLEIPLKILDLRTKFRQDIIQPFIKSYLNGETPNPCVLCNQVIKCGALLDWAVENGFSRMASGHYAQISEDSETGHYLLLRGSDLRKDQSYFLYRLNQRQLSQLIFPLGTWTKKAVEEQMVKMGLPDYHIQDSQEICFIKTQDYRAYLREITPQAFKVGPVFDKLGNKIGDHTGFFNYTVGQRKGLQLIKKGPNYVLAVIPDKNWVIIGNDQDLWKNTLVADDTSKIISPWPEKVLAQIRSTQPAKEATLNEMADGRVRVHFTSPVRAITPGQSVVFYKNEICLGGGIIQSDCLHAHTMK